MLARCSGEAMKPEFTTPGLAKPDPWAQAMFSAAAANGSPAAWMAGKIRAAQGGRVWEK